jgi:PAS domain S-box-containing protein
MKKHRRVPVGITMSDNGKVQAKRYERIVRLATEGIWTVDSNGLTDFINEQGAAMLGYSPEDMLGRPLSDFVYHEDKEMLELAPDRIKRGESGRFEVRMPRKDGSEVWLMVSTSPMIGADGRFCGALSMASDITERKRMEERLRESEERYRLLIEHAPTGIYEIDFRAPRFTSVNDVMARQTGYSRDELLSINPLDILDIDSRRKFLERVRRSSSGKDIDESVDYTIIRKDGRRMDVTLNAMLRFEEGKVVGAFVIAHDITERKNYENEIERSNAELQQFAYVASHDLQEPLRMVSIYLGLLEKKFGGELSPQAREFVGVAVEGAERMRHLIDDLLTYSRIESPRNAFSPVDMNEVVAAVLSELRVPISESEAEVIIYPLSIVNADETQMKQLMSNLIANALKFRGSSKPRIEISAITYGDDLVFSIKDNGIGIDPRYHEQLFQMFSRLHTRDEYPGTGIGLAIAKKIVERHGGRIWVESEVDRGSTFFFSLPARE